MFSAQTVTARSSSALGLASSSGRRPAAGGREKDIVDEVKENLCHVVGHDHNQMVLRLGVVALGVEDVSRAADFWGRALGYQIRRDGFGGWSTVLTSPDGTGTQIALQRSQTPPQDHPRLHFDLHAADAAEQAAEVERLVSIGAVRVDWDSYPDDPDFVVLADPDGNLFCVVDLSH